MGEEVLRVPLHPANRSLLVAGSVCYDMATSMLVRIVEPARGDGVETNGNTPVHLIFARAVLAAVPPGPPLVEVELPVLVDLADAVAVAAVLRPDLLAPFDLVEVARGLSPFQAGQLVAQIESAVLADAPRAALAGLVPQTLAPSLPPALRSMETLARRHRGEGLTAAMRAGMAALDLPDYNRFGWFEIRPSRFGRGVFARRALPAGALVGYYPPLPVFWTDSAYNASLVRARTTARALAEQEDTAYNPTVHTRWLTRYAMGGPGQATVNPVDLFGRLLPLYEDWLVPRVNEASDATPRPNAVFSRASTGRGLVEVSLRLTCAVAADEEILTCYGRQYARSNYEEGALCAALNDEPQGQLLPAMRALC